LRGLAACRPAMHGRGEFQHLVCGCKLPCLPNVPPATQCRHSGSDQLPCCYCCRWWWQPACCCRTRPRTETCWGAGSEPGGASVSRRPCDAVPAQSRHFWLSLEHYSSAA
jgi:hypothetical protein